MVDKIFEEALEVISDGQEELKEEKNIVFDKTTKQSSIKIPKSLALKSGLNGESKFNIVFNPNQEDTIKEINKSKLVIYLEVKNGEGEESS